MGPHWPAFTRGARALCSNAEADPDAPAGPPGGPAGAEPAAATLAVTNPLPTTTSPTEPTPPALAEERLRPIEQPAPEFPAALVQTLRRGSVRVQFNVLSDGRVDQAEVVSSSHARLIPAALAAIQQWRFQPVARTQAAQVDLAFNID